MKTETEFTTVEARELEPNEEVFTVHPPSSLNRELVGVIVHPEFSPWRAVGACSPPL